MRKGDKSVEGKTEQCVLCGVDTGVLVNMPADARKYYVIGIGQLCELCFQSLHRENTSVSK